jgi:hypothetical protein
MPATGIELLVVSQSRRERGFAATPFLMKLFMELFLIGSVMQKNE